MNTKTKPHVQIVKTNAADGPFKFHDMAMSKDKGLAIAGRLLKRVHNALAAGLEEEVGREPDGLIAGDLLDAGANVAGNLLCEIVHFAARPRFQRDGKRAAYIAIANEFERQAQGLSLTLFEVAAEYRKYAAES